MRGKLVAGNWKMHGNQAFVTTLMEQLRLGLDARALEVEIVICPAVIHLPLALNLLAGSPIMLGAQNVFYAEEGAYTGEVSASMLQDFGVKFVIVGHSERRQYFGENDQQVIEKFAAVQKQGMTPILCVGESLEQRENGETNSVVLEQINAVIDKIGIRAFAPAVIAYEPIWAIGTGQTATPAQAQEVHGMIRDYLAEQDENIALQTRIIYGGSVTAKNATELFLQKDIDGGLVGGASLKADDFTYICKSLG